MSRKRFIPVYMQYLMCLCLPCWLTIAGAYNSFHWYRNSHYHKDLLEFVKRTHEQYHASKFKPPKPMPWSKSKRRRRLTLSERDLQQIELTSPLFRLPLKVRKKIYAECVEHEVRLLLLPMLGIRGTGVKALGLLQSCKTIYSEAIDVIYSTPTFNFVNLPSFLAFCATTVPQRIKTITSIDILLDTTIYPPYGSNAAKAKENSVKKSIRSLQTRNGAMRYPLIQPSTIALEYMRKALEQFSSLTKLQVALSFDYFGSSVRYHASRENPWKDEQEVVMIPLSRLAQNGLDFEVSVDWPLVSCFDDVDENPFKVVRRKYNGSEGGRLDNLRRFRDRTARNGS